LVIQHKSVVTRGTISELLKYPFHVLDCQRISAVTPSHYSDWIDALERIGLSREGLKRKGFGDDDAVMTGLLREEWLSGPFRPRGMSNGKFGLSTAST